MGQSGEQPGEPATFGSVHELAVALRLEEVGYRRAAELAGLRPGRGDWLRWLDRFLAAVGALLIVAGIAAFFAWNWADLGHMARFALIQAGVAGAVAIVLWRGMDSTGGRVAFVAAAFLVGVLLAVFGQVYQTGADPYGLFLAWAILVLPWAVVGRQGGLWLLFQLLLNLALILYWIQVLHPPDGWWQLTQLLGPLVWLGSTVMDWRLASLLFGLNAAAVIAWELAASRGTPWLESRWFSRLVGLIALYTVLGPTLVMIFAAGLNERAQLAIVSPLLFAAALLASLWYYQYRKLDLFMLTIAMFGGILVIMALAIRYLFADFGSTLFLALLLIALVAGAAVWLRTISQRWQVVA